MPGSVLEAGNLLILRDQVEDRVENEVDQRELSVDTGRGKVADGDIDLLASRLAAQPRHHRFRRIDPMDTHATFGQRQRDPAGTYPQLQRATLGSQVRKRLHYWRDNSLVKHVGGKVVIDRRDSLAEIPRAIVLRHDPPLTPRVDARRPNHQPPRVS